MMTTGQGRILVIDPASGALVGLVMRKDLLQIRATVVHSERERRAFPCHRAIRRARQRYEVDPAQSIARDAAGASGPA
ncbi:hypothetical protein J2X36_005086 [Methylobacterium sp. BE186]|uniref:hypothetical protein n=1 Tax=Methylobacterium sp. BE186 TaxID=2817715 RepID=UPI002862D022|nr:hypothetical protein [Methylobacterium sp. BE186]MDR7040304.1 hypothetical protein [Methylobacterium sp. BE186]